MSKLNTTKKEINAATKGLKSKDGFRILTGKRSFGKVDTLAELREKLYQLINNNNYKTYSVENLDSKEVKEILNFNTIDLEESNNTKEDNVIHIEEKKIETPITTKEVNLTKYFLNIKEKGKNKSFEVLAESEEEALYNVVDTLQLWKGIEFIRNYKKNYLYQNFSGLEDQLKTKSKCVIHEDIWLIKTRQIVTRNIRTVA